MNLRLKINSKNQKLQIVSLSRINSTNKINSILNHPNLIKPFLEPLKSLLTF